MSGTRNRRQATHWKLVIAVLAVMGAIVGVAEPAFADTTVIGATQQAGVVYWNQARTDTWASNVVAIQGVSDDAGGIELAIAMRPWGGLTYARVSVFSNNPWTSLINDATNNSCVPGGTFYLSTSIPETINYTVTWHANFSYNVSIKPTMC